MSDPSKEDAHQLVAVKREVCTTNEEIPRALHVPSSEAAEAEVDGIYHLSGKPFFDVVLAKSHIAPIYQLYVPKSMVQLLPCVTIPVVFRYGGKNWNLSYTGDSQRPRLHLNWGTFVEENHLKLGDACVFELMEKSNTILKFKVHILRSDLPPELQAMIVSRGETTETPIGID